MSRLHEPVVWSMTISFRRALPPFRGETLGPDQVVVGVEARPRAPWRTWSGRGPVRRSVRRLAGSLRAWGTPW